jgi:hypothetical protein
VTIFDYEKVDVCNGNVLWVGDQTEKTPKQSRSNDLKYEIPSLTDDSEPFRVHAKEVFSQKEKTDCPLATYPEYFNYETNTWDEVRSDTHQTVNMQ